LDRTFEDFNEHDALLQQAAKRYQLPFELVKRQTWAETKGVHNPVLPEGANSLLLLMPSVWNVPSPEGRAIDAQCRYLKLMLRHYEGEIRPAVAAFDLGAGQVSWLRMNHGPRWERFLPKGTLDYMEAVIGKDPKE